MPSPDFQVERSGNTISVAGRLDFTTATAVLAAVNEHLHATKSSQVIDLAGISSSNSAGLAVMIEWLAEAQRANQALTFENIPDSLRQISTVCQVDSLI